MAKFKILLALFGFLLAFLIHSSAYAASEVTIVNPIRGDDFWQYSYPILTTSQAEYKVISDRNLSATWLVRYDALVKPDVQTFLKSLNGKQEVGLFLEITPTLAKDAGVTYHQSSNWHAPESIFLTGYSVDERHKLIDTAFEKFKSIFGSYPKSVGAWWIDAGSLTYLHDKYHVQANMDVADQYSTDQYQIWGQYFSLPFYPSKVNALMPASSPDKKIGLVTIQWATRDPYNSYGFGANESTYSVQPNDYMLHNLGVSYFNKLLDVYPQVTVGLENDFDFTKYGSEYTAQIQSLTDRAARGQLKVETMSDFAASYQKANPDVSPHVLLIANDPLGSDGKVIWYQTPHYRVGWFYGSYGVAIRDLRIFSDSTPESCYQVACKQLDFSKVQTNVLDEVTYGTHWTLDEGKISNLQVSELGDEVKISYQNQAGTPRTLRFLANDIDFNGHIQPIDFAILSAAKQSENSPSITEGGVMTNKDILQAVPNQLLQLIKFLLFSLFFFVIPGWVMTRCWLISLPVGWVLFTAASYLFGYFAPLFILWAIPLFSTLILFRSLKKKDLKLTFKRTPIIPTLIILIGSICWLITTVKSGLPYSYGIGFWGPNGHDGIWHLGLISQLTEHFPPINPFYAGVPLHNYHYFFDLLLARTSTFSQIPAIDLLFRLFPLTIAITLGAVWYQLVTLVSGRSRVGTISLLWIYFGGSLGWIFSFIKDRSLGGESMFWAQQSISTLLNPPFAISLVLLFSGLYLLLMPGKRTLWQNICLVLTLGTLVEFKTYAGILVLGAIGLVALEKLVKERDLSWMVITFISGVVSAAVFLPNNFGSNSLIVFAPLWFIQSMIDFPDRLGWYRLSLTLHSGNLLKEIYAYTVGGLVFFGGNFGTRVIGIFNRENFKYRLFIWIWLIGIILPMLFIQTGTNWNTIQFMYYSLMISSLFVGLTLDMLWQKFGLKVGLALVGLLILVTLPTTYDTLQQYLPNRPPTALSNQELQALKFLGQQPQGTVMTYPFDEKIKSHYTEPVPLQTYTSTGYVSAFSGQQTFLEDLINLDILGVDYKGRLNTQRDFFHIHEQIPELIKDNNITYVYLPKRVNPESDGGELGLTKIFENDEVRIFKK